MWLFAKKVHECEPQEPRASTEKTPKTQPSPQGESMKKNAGESKNPALQRVGPDRRRRPDPPEAQKTKEKNTKKRPKPKGQEIQKKTPGKAKTLAPQRVWPKFWRGPGGPANPRKNTKKRKNLKRPKSFLKKFGVKPAAASCPSGKSCRAPGARPSRAESHAAAQEPEVRPPST